MKLKRTKTEVRDLTIFSGILMVIVFGLVAYISYVNFYGLVDYNKTEVKITNPSNK